jgi:hypothetical protein
MFEHTQAIPYDGGNSRGAVHHPSTWGNYLYMRPLPGVSLALGLAMFAAGPVLSQTNPTVANVYVQSHKGVFAFHANAAGQLTRIPGSQFADTGQMAAIRGSYFIAIGGNVIHDYALTSTGGIGGEVAEINTQNYGGAQCGTMQGEGSILDHTGQYFSVQLYGATNSDGSFVCSAWQTYKIASNGQFTFLGDAVNTTQFTFENSALPIELETVSSNDAFDYGIAFKPGIGETSFSAFQRGMAGDLIPNGGFTHTDPAGTPSQTQPQAVAADPANHLAVFLGSKLASYSINNVTGAIQSANNWADLPTVSTGPNPAAMSPSGNLMAIGGEYGFQIFHFNGAAAPTAYGGVLQPDVFIDQLAWDNSNHLYILSDTPNSLDSNPPELYVYTVTTKTITEVPGSPYAVPDAYGTVGLIVVPKT